MNWVMVFRLIALAGFGSMVYALGHWQGYKRGKLVAQIECSIERTTRYQRILQRWEHMPTQGVGNDDRVN